MTLGAHRFDELPAAIDVERRTHDCSIRHEVDGERRHPGGAHDLPDRQRRLPPIRLRHGVEIEDPLSVLLGLLTSWRFEAGDVSGSFAESDLRLANRGGARISAAEIESILGRRPAIELALRAIPPDASLAGPADAMPWLQLRQLFDAFTGLRGVGLSKMTKALHPKRPALIPMLDSIVQKYLRDDDPGPRAVFGERALVLVRGYKHDLDRNRAVVDAARRELARRGHAVTEVRVLDLLILSAETAANR